MLSILRKRLTYTNVAMTLALVFAMTGGAYAASHYLITSTKQISPKVLKALKGKSGKSGANGAQGAAGSAGPQGAAGSNGSSGGNGTSVTSKEVKVGEATCGKLGGSEFTSASGKTTACNGKDGSPWTAGGNLPSGQTLRGEWGIHHKHTGFDTSTSTVSFALPLQAAPAAHILNVNGKELVLKGGVVKEESSTVCTGTPAEPTAPSGTLCVYTFREEGLVEPAQWVTVGGSPNNVAICGWGAENSCAANTASRFGFGVEYNSAPTGEEVDVRGTWAVTG